METTTLETTACLVNDFPYGAIAEGVSKTGMPKGLALCVMCGVEYKGGIHLTRGRYDVYIYVEREREE